MKLECYSLVREPPVMVPARHTRKWMDNTDDRYAYRCLPLTIANAHGWELLCPSEIYITWNGKPEKKDIVITNADGSPHSSFAQSHFKTGIVTFHIGYLFRTDPGWDLMISGSFNEPKDGLYPLTGIVETDWAPYTATMNWQITRPGTFSFKKDEPFCSIMLIPHAYLNNVVPEVKKIEDSPELYKHYAEWRDKRNEFNYKSEKRDPEVMAQKWQKDYFVGRNMCTGEVSETHVNKVRLKQPV